MSDNLPAAQGAATKHKDRMDALIHAVQQRADQLVILLEQSGISFERFVEVFRRALINDPALVDADAASVVQACINACTDGLLPDKRQAAIVVYNVNVAPKDKPKRFIKQAQYQPMYQGLLDLAYRSGLYRSIEARVVYEGDHFEYELGDQPFIKHRPKPRPAGVKAPAIVASYAVAVLTNGGVFREIFEGADIAKVKAVSRATSGPGVNWPEEMARKGPLRRMWKFIPKSAAMARIVERDLDLPDAAPFEAEEQAPKTLKTGFAALPQGADPVMPDAEIEQEAEIVDAEVEDPAPKEQEQEMRADVVNPPKDDGPKEPDALRSFKIQLAKAETWRQARSALQAYAATDPGDIPYQAAQGAAWRRQEALAAAGDKTDFVTDPLLFLCWVRGADHTQAGGIDALRGNLAVIEKERTFNKLPPDHQQLIRGAVEDMIESLEGNRDGN